MAPPEPLWYNHRIPGLNSSVLGDDPGTLPMALLKEDIWVGKAITDARVAYESWIGLLNGEIRIEPEHCPGAVCGPYANVFANYAKAAFLGAVAVPYRGFFEFKNGVLVKTEDVYYRMREMVSGEQLDEFLKLTAPLRNLRNKDQHREEHPPVWSILPRPSPPTHWHLRKGFRRSVAHL